MKNRKILGLVGETGSGKDAFVKYVKREHKEVFCFRFIDPVSEFLKVLAGGVRKQDQSWLAPLLRRRFGNNVLGDVIERKIRNIQKGIIILNGIRAWEEYEMIKRLGGIVIYITADSKTRWRRVRKRGEKKDDNVSFNKFLKIGEAETESLISKIGKKADFKIENSGSKKNFEREIEKILKR